MIKKILIGSLMFVSLIMTKIAPVSATTTQPKAQYTNSYNFGINTFSWDDQEKLPSTTDSLIQMQYGYQQFPNNVFWSWTKNASIQGFTHYSSALSLQNWGSWLEKTHEKGLYIINYDENPNWTGPDTLANVKKEVQFIVNHHYPVNAYVIGSEIYGPWDFIHNLNTNKSALYYAKKALIFMKAIKKIAPKAQVGVDISIGNSPYTLHWNQIVMQVDGTYANFFSLHDYPLEPPFSRSQLLQQLPSDLIRDVQLIQSEMNANLPSNHRPSLWMTEFSPTGQPYTLSTQPIYETAILEGELALRAVGIQKIFNWALTSSALGNPKQGQPHINQPGQPYGTFGMIYSGLPPQKAAGSFTPAGQGMQLLLHLVRKGAEIQSWIGSKSMVSKIVSKKEGVITDLFFNESSKKRSIVTILTNGKKTIFNLPALSFQISHLPLRSVLLKHPQELKINKIRKQTPPIITNYTRLSAPGRTVTIYGNNFGNNPGNGYIYFYQGYAQWLNPIYPEAQMWNEPGSYYQFQATKWTNREIQFIIPNGSGHQTGPKAGFSIHLAIVNNLWQISNFVDINIINSY